MIKNSFTIEDIHRIRRENYEKTKAMSPIELIAETNRKAATVEKTIHEMRKTKQN
jgi:hypothetical protein